MLMKTKALVLREVSYKESDRILTLLTQERGTLSATPGGAGKRAAPLPPGPSFCAGRSWCFPRRGAAGR